MDNHEIERKMQQFARTAFSPFTKLARSKPLEERASSEKIDHIIDAVMELAQQTLTTHEASAILTRTEEDPTWGTCIHIRVACKSNSTMDVDQREQLIRNALVADIKAKAPLLMAQSVENTLDGMNEVRLRVPTNACALKLAWKQHRAKWSVKLPLFLCGLVILCAFGALATFYHQSGARDEL